MYVNDVRIAQRLNALRLPDLPPVFRSEVDGSLALFGEVEICPDTTDAMIAAMREFVETVYPQVELFRLAPDSLGISVSFPGFPDLPNREFAEDMFVMGPWVLLNMMLSEDEWHRTAVEVKTLISTGVMYLSVYAHHPAAMPS